MEIIRRFKKNEKGSITVMVLTAMLFMLVVITISYLSISNESIGQNKKISQISKQYQVTNDDMEQEYYEVYNSIDFTNGLGDVNLDKKIEEVDIGHIQAYLEGNVEFNDEQKLRADINRDQQITKEDIIELSEYLGIESTEEI